MNDRLQDQFFGHQHVTEINPPKGWRMLDWRELWAYRELLSVLTMRDIKVRYKQTVLGAGWAIIRPFLTMVIFSVVFGQFATMPLSGPLSGACANALRAARVAPFMVDAGCGCHIGRQWSPPGHQPPGRAPG